MKKKKQTRDSRTKFGIDNCSRLRSNRKMYNVNSTTIKNRTINKSKKQTKQILINLYYFKVHLVKDEMG